MKGDRALLYTSERDFYELEGSVSMKLSPRAAADVCRSAAAHGLVVARVEGGIRDDSGFEARHDCIWDGVDPPIDVAAAISNNNAAAEFIDKQSNVHNAFILTAPPMTGWPHKRLP